MRGQFRAAIARSLSALAASALAVALVMAPAGAATAASGTTWTIQKSPNVTLPGGEIQSVSCVTATSCEAVGSFLNKDGITDTLAESWNGKSWRKQKTPNPPGDNVPAVSPVLSGVSCPAAGFCEAIGSFNSGRTGVPLAETWDGTSWTIQPVPSPAGSTSAVPRSVSCASATFCEAVGRSSTGSGVVPLAEDWDGTSWQVQSVPGPAGHSFEELFGVSCASASFCEAVGNGPASPSFADVWNGTSWALQSMPGHMGSVSCVSASFCAAVGSAGATGSAIWDGTSWTAQPVPGPVGSFGTSLHAVSCSSAQACEAVGDFQTAVFNGATLTAAEEWNGTSWTAQSAPSPAGVTSASLTGVSCPAAGACEAGGDFGQTPQSVLQALAEAWNGTSWALQAAAAPPGATTNGLNGVSCVTAHFCEAVGSAEGSARNTASLAETWNGSAWRIQATPAGAIMSGVSCVSAHFCEAVGFSAATSGAAAEIWDGKSWTAQAVAGSSGLDSVSCTSAHFCLAVGGSGETDTWDGSTWSQQPAIGGFRFTNSVSCASPSFCEAVGDGSSSTQSAAAWDGTAWSVQTVPVPANGSTASGLALNGVSCVTATSCEAVGFYFTSGTFEQLTLAERWDGSTWAVQSTPNPTASTINDLLGVWCTSADSCVSVGDQTPSATLTLAQSWDGTSWTEQSSANRSSNDLNVLSSVSCTRAGACTAVGAGADLGSINATLVETNDQGRHHRGSH
jgi:hypothetical protein